jgi:hypothetical protein
MQEVFYEKAKVLLLFSGSNSYAVDKMAQKIMNLIDFPLSSYFNMLVLNISLSKENDHYVG